MKAHHHRQKVQNGTVVRRAGTRAGAARESARAPRRGASERQREAAPEQGSRVLWIMIALGGLLTIGFVLGVRSQITAHQINQAEERLRTELDRAATQQKFLSIEQERAMSPGESTRAGREAGLLQMKLNETGGQINALPARPVVRPLAPAPGESSEEAESDAPALRPFAAKPAAGRPAPAPASLKLKSSPRARVAPAVLTYPARGAASRNVVRVSRDKAAGSAVGKSQARPAAVRAAAPQKASKPAAKAAAGAKGAKKEPVNPRQVARVAPRR
ncbi:MAG: hypothetical protein SF339_20290 [Blastocatellia bacterium]|nr:hypothetical protein [Blastocatellia bacterium]